MAKSKVFKVIISFFSIVVGLVIGALGCLFYTSPDSYRIPDAVEASGNVVVGDIDVQTVKQKDLSIHFLELGNKHTGDCTLIKVGDTEMLVDAGSKASSIPTIKAYLDNYVEGELDYVVVTHAHEDHYAGFATNEETESLFDIYDVGTIIDFGTATNNEVVEDDGKTTMFENYVRERDAEVVDGAKYFPIQDYFSGYKVRRFEFKAGSGVFVEMLYQKYYYEEDEETENNYSVCFQIVYDDKYYLFTGDLEKEGEASLVEEHTKDDGKNKDMLHEVELYKAGHHGSKTSSTEVLMNVVKPKVVCVCCCAGSNQYTNKSENQFPTQKFIDNVYKANPDAKIYVTTLCVDYKQNSFTSFNGNIVVCAKAGEERTIFFSNSDIELKDTEWFKKNRTMPAVA